MYVEIDPEVERQDVQCRQWRFSAFFEGEFLGFAEMNIKNTKSHLNNQTSRGIVRPTREPKVYIQERGTDLYVKLVEGSPLGRLCDELEYAYSWQQGEPLPSLSHTAPRLLDGKKTNEYCTDNFVSLVAVTRQTPSFVDTVPIGHDPAWRDRVPEKKKWKRQCLIA